VGRNHRIHRLPTGGLLGLTHEIDAEVLFDLDGYREVLAVSHQAELVLACGADALRE
jgi:hypothetical protein